MRTTKYDMLDVIRERFANRALKQDNQVSDQTLEALVEAAAQAPSCFNEQPWRFLIAKGERKDRLARRRPGADPGQEDLYIQRQ